MVHQLQSNAQENLNDQIHHDMHDADMHKHIRNKAPNFITSIWIIDEQCCGWSICILANLFVVARVVTEKEKQKQNDTRMQFIDKVNEVSDCSSLHS